MALPDVGNCSTVAGYIAFQPISSSGNGINQKGTCRNGYAIHGIVGSHDGGELIPFNQCFVGAKVKFAHVTGVHVRTAGVSIKLSIVGYKVFATGYCF